MDKCVSLINILLQQDRNTCYCIAKVLQLSCGSLVLQGSVTNPKHGPNCAVTLEVCSDISIYVRGCAGMVLWPRFGHLHTAPPGQICNRALVSTF